MTRIALQIHRVSATNPTGVHRYVWSLARALTQAAPDEARVELWAGREDDGDHAVDGVDVHAWPIQRRLLHLSWTVVRRPYAERYAGDVALVHALAAAVPVPTRRPFVATIHDLLPMTHPQWYDRQARWVVSTSIRHAVAHATRIITPSEHVRDQLHDLLGVDAGRLTVIPEGAEGTFSRALDGAALAATTSRYDVEPGRYFVTVGEVTPRKNLTTLFEAMASTRNDLLPLLVVGGDGLDAARIKAAATALGVQSRVRFTGRVDDQTLATLVQGARALLHPSSYEGFGLTPLEAMAAGTAVVSSSAGSLPEVVGDAGMLVDPRDVGGWAGAMARVGGDDEWVRQAVEAGRARSARFSWETAAASTWAVYGEVLGC